MIMINKHRSEDTEARRTSRKKMRKVPTSVNQTPPKSKQASICRLGTINGDEEGAPELKSPQVPAPLTGE
jgi:hypothetical protein